jgi:predicted nucleic acid-binding Zn ribbon protein
MSPAKVPNHAHCAQCGKAIPPDDRTCGPDCADEVEEQDKKRKRMMYITYGLLAAGFLLVVVGPMFLN